MRVGLEQNGWSYYLFLYRYRFGNLHSFAGIKTESQMGMVADSTCEGMMVGGDKHLKSDFARISIFVISFLRI